MATVAPVDNAHCSGATPSKSRVAIPFGHPMWPAHVARICSGVRIMLALYRLAEPPANMASGHCRWPLSLPSTHCSAHGGPGQARPGQAMWPAHVARICSGVRIMLALLSVGRTTGQRGQWPLSMATVAPTGHFLLGRGLLGRLGTLLRLATRTGSVGHGSVGHQNLKSRRALGVGSARAPGERWKVSTSQYHFVVARWPG
jgi:hypothetical protein